MNYIMLQKQKIVLCQKRRKKNFFWKVVGRKGERRLVRSTQDQRTGPPRSQSQEAMGARTRC